MCNFETILNEIKDIHGHKPEPGDYERCIQSGQQVQQEQCEGKTTAELFRNWLDYRA